MMGMNLSRAGLGRDIPLRAAKHQAVKKMLLSRPMVGVAAEYNSACVNTLRRSRNGYQLPGFQVPVSGCLQIRELDMDEDFFSELSKKATGFDLVFALTGVLWLLSTVMGLIDGGVETLTVSVPLWLSFAGFFHLIKKREIKSTWLRAVGLFIFLHIWKIVLTVGILMVLA